MANTILSLNPSHEGCNFANLVQRGLLTGVIVVDAHQQILGMTPDAADLLRQSNTAGAESAPIVLPTTLQSLAREATTSAHPLVRRQIELPNGVNGAHLACATALPLSWAGSDSKVVLILNELGAPDQVSGHVRQLERLAELGTLAAGMAHEIKNALVAIKTFLDLLLEKNQDMELVDIARRELGRVEAIVGRMLNFSGLARAAFKPVRLHEVLEHSIRVVQPKLESKSVVLERSLKAAHDLINGDTYELEQAFVNLLLNAVEATAPGGKLTVATANNPEAPQLSISIKDTGEGIAPNNLSRVFEPFFTTKPTGTGLGLAITQRILQEHGATITVESQKGQGTEFKMLMPTVGTH